MVKLFQLLVLALSLFFQVSIYAMPSYDDVLVVVNLQSPDSVAIGNYFKKARNIPEINIVKVSIPDRVSNEGDNARATIAEKNLILSTIKSKFDETVKDENGELVKLAEKINFIVLTRGIPIYAENNISKSNTNPNPYHLTDLFIMYNLSESALNPLVPDFFTTNKFFYYNNLDVLSRKFSHNQFGYYIVSRLDGPGLSNIKSLIDNTGAPAYSSYKHDNKVKLLTVSPYYNKTFLDEFNLRGNIEIVSPCPIPPDNQDFTKPDECRITQTFDKVAKNVMFAFLNHIPWETFYPWPRANNYYADGDLMDNYPFIYRGATFLPGSVVMGYRSLAANKNFRTAGGALKFDLLTNMINDFQQSDGSDMKFRHMTCVAYDPVNNWLWCGTGEPQLNVSHDFDARATDEVHKEHMRNYGGGIAIIDANSGAVIKHINANDPGSSLKNNRVVKLVYDKAWERIWIGHYNGIQYYDLKTNQWHDVNVLQNVYASDVNIYLDPFNNNKIYFSFYYDPNYRYNVKISSDIPGAATDIFEYSKDSGAITSYTIDPHILGVLPQMAKTSANIIWLTKGRFRYDNRSKNLLEDAELIKYDLSIRQILQSIKFSEIVPEIVESTHNIEEVVLDVPRTMTSLSAVEGNGVLVDLPCRIKYRNLIEGKLFQRKNYLLRLYEKSANSAEIELINSDFFNVMDAEICPDFIIRSIVGCTSQAGVLYAALSRLGGSQAVIAKSIDFGKSWNKICDDVKKIDNLNSIVLDGKGSLYAVRGYQLKQNIMSDFAVNGACAFGGGLAYEDMEYRPGLELSWYSGLKGPYYAESGSWQGDGYRGYSQLEPIMFMLLDGFTMAESRFGVFAQYPMNGGGGHTGHMLVFEPKCTPFAPRVDEENLNGVIYDNSRIEIPLRSPGLPTHLDKFIQETINSMTVQVFDANDIPVIADKIEYSETGNKIIVTGDFSGFAYKVKLICGINGIKNIKGASLTNTRSNEFNDYIICHFGNGIDLYNNGYFSLNKSNKLAKSVGLTVSDVAIPDVPVSGKSLQVKFTIKNINHEASGDYNRKIAVYFDNTKVGSIDSGDIEPGKSKVLSFDVDGKFVTPGVLHKILVMVDSRTAENPPKQNSFNFINFFIENRPDLIVKDITISATPSAGNQVTVSFKIANIGIGATKSGDGVQKATLYIDGKSTGTICYNDINQGESTALQIPLERGAIPYGVHKLKVVADSSNHVKEINESNNALERGFAVGQ